MPKCWFCGEASDELQECLSCTICPMDKHLFCALCIPYIKCPYREVEVKDNDN